MSDQAYTSDGRELDWRQFGCESETEFRQELEAWRKAARSDESQPPQPSEPPLTAAVVAWIRSRNALSSECQSLGISSSDELAWLREVERRERPLRKAAEKYMTDNGLWTEPSEPGPVCERCGDTGCPACTIREFQAAGAEVHLLTPEGVVPPADKAVWKCLRPECGKTFNKFPFSQLCPACNAACAKVTTPTDPKPCADPICDCQGLAAETKAADPNRGRVVIEELRRWPSKGYDEEERANAIYDAVAADLAKRKR